MLVLASDLYEKLVRGIQELFSLARRLIYTLAHLQGATYIFFVVLQILYLAVVEATPKSFEGLDF